MRAVSHACQSRDDGDTSCLVGSQLLHTQRLLEELACSLPTSYQPSWTRLYLPIPQTTFTPSRARQSIDGAHPGIDMSVDADPNVDINVDDIDLEI